MSDATDRYQELAAQVEARRPEWVTARQTLQSGGLRASSRPVEGGGSSGTDKPMPELDDVDRQVEKFRFHERMVIKVLKPRMELHSRIARQAFGADAQSKHGKACVQIVDKAAVAAVRHLQVMLAVMDWAKPLEASEARKLAEEAASPGARTCANPYCAAIVERLLGERCRNCHDFWTRVGLERPERLIYREIERSAR